MTDGTPRFSIGDVGRKIGIIDHQRGKVAIFHGNEPRALKRRLDWAESGLNDGSVTTRDFVWEDMPTPSQPGTPTEGETL